jgi:hypothetical protein
MIWIMGVLWASILVVILVDIVQKLKTSDDIRWGGYLALLVIVSVLSGILSNFT